MDPLTLKVAARYRQASSPLWDDASEALRLFNERYDTLQHLKEPLDEAGEKVINSFAFNRDGARPTFTGAPFQIWMEKCGDPTLKDPETLRVPGREVLEVAEGKKSLPWLQAQMESYKDAIQAQINASADERFSYQGFKITNTSRMSEYRCRKLLEGIDFLVALFKSKGMEHLLHIGLREVQLIPESGDTWAGLYMTHIQTIILPAKEILVGGTGRFIDWVNEVFLHEFGHHIHLFYLAKEAKAAWDSGWAEVKSRREEIKEAFQVITGAERARFFKLLQDSGFDPSKAAKRLEPVAKVKFGVWLRNPYVNDPLITPSQLRWSKSGLYMASFFKDPVAFMKEHYEIDSATDPAAYAKQYAILEKRMNSKLGLLDDGPQGIPFAVVEELEKSDTSMKKAVDEAIERLEIVSSYGKKNEDEDFAETFVAFLADPAKLTPTAKFRMQRALSLSGLYSKPVMKLGEERVVERFYQLTEI